MKYVICSIFLWIKNLETKYVVKKRFFKLKNYFTLYCHFMVNDFWLIVDDVLPQTEVSLSKQKVDFEYQWIKWSLQLKI